MSMTHDQLITRLHSIYPRVRGQVVVLRSPDGGEYEVSEIKDGVVYIKPVEYKMAMRTMRQIKALARILHRAQIYESFTGGPAGPYFETHIEDVVRRLLAFSWVPCWHQEAAAYLHDAVEDGHITLEQMYQLEIPGEVIRLVDSLTRRAGETYADYIDRVKADPRAVAVKLADLRSNLAAGPPERLKKRYEDAIRELGGLAP